MDSMVVVCFREFLVGRTRREFLVGRTRREFLVGRTRRVRVGGQLSKEVKVTSGVPQGSVLGPSMFLAYINDIWRNVDSSIRLFADDCIIYRKITDKNDIENCRKIWILWGNGR